MVLVCVNCNETSIVGICTESGELCIRCMTGVVQDFITIPTIIEGVRLLDTDESIKYVSDFLEIDEDPDMARKIGGLTYTSFQGPIKVKFGDFVCKTVRGIETFTAKNFRSKYQLGRF